MTRLFLVLFCTLLCSRQLFNIKQILTYAERQLTSASASAPDSALTTMRSIKKYALLNPKHRAQYGLIYSIALDKNRIDVAADSLIRSSARYFDYKGSPEQRMKAYYYLGRVQENAKQYLPATLSFLDAAQYTDTVDNNYLKGLLYSRLGMMYEQYNRYNTALEMFEKSYNYYKAANLKHHQAFQLYRIGILCHTIGQIERGISVVKDAIILANKHDFSQLVTMCNYILIVLYDSNKQYNEAYQIIQQLPNSDYCNNTLFIGAAAHVLHCNGKTKEAKQLINNGWNLSKTEIDSSMMFFYQSICVLLSCSKDALYNRSSRIRRKVKNSSSSKKEFFLKHL